MNYIFDINYKNNAWGYSNNGSLIISDGSVRKYDLSKMRGASGLHNKIQNSDYKNNISHDVMSQLSQLANNVRQENLYDTNSAAFDAGTFTFTMYNTIDKTE